MADLTWLHLLVSYLIWSQVHVSSSTLRPNIVLIVADDLGWNDIGFHGSEIKTPNLDRLAYEGVILNNYYVSPICTPTRGSLMTGRHPIHLGLQHGVINANTPYGLPLNHTTMGEHFQHLGYAAHIVGKWHLGFFKESYLPTNRGFDSHYGYWTGKEDYYTHVDKDGYSGLDFRDNMAPINETAYSTELYTARTRKLIYSHDKSKPLFLYLPYQSVHAGNSYDTIQAPDAYVNRFPYIANIKRRKFAGMVAALDDSVGAVVGALQDTGMMKNTVIVFTTDNGGPANNYDGNAACNYPLRGTKNTLWEGGVHGVGFVHSPLLQKTQYKSKHLIHVSDWLPTLYHVAGGNLSDLGTIDGLNQWETISMNSGNVRTELLHNIDPKSKFSAIRVGDYKLIQGHISGRNDDWYPCTPPKMANETDFDSYLSLLEQVQETEYISQYHYSAKHNRHIRDAPYTPYNIDCGDRPKNSTTNCKPEKQPCLFHVPSDPCEFNNIADGNEIIVNNLLKRLDDYAATAVQPVNKPPDNRANPALHGGLWVPWLGK